MIELGPRQQFEIRRKLIQFWLELRLEREFLPLVRLYRPSFFRVMTAILTKDYRTFSLKEHVPQDLVLLSIRSHTFLIVKRKWM
jgi:hypothetical protein